jgi:hypothetical protein
MNEVEEMPVGVSRLCVALQIVASLCEHAAAFHIRISASSIVACLAGSIWLMDITIWAVVSLTGALLSTAVLNRCIITFASHALDFMSMGFVDIPWMFCSTAFIQAAHTCFAGACVQIKRCALPPLAIDVISIVLQEVARRWSIRAALLHWFAASTYVSKFIAEEARAIQVFVSRFLHISGRAWHRQAVSLFFAARHLVCIGAQLVHAEGLPCICFVQEVRWAYFVKTRRLEVTACVLIVLLFAFLCDALDNFCIRFLREAMGANVSVAHCPEIAASVTVSVRAHEALTFDCIGI